MVLVPHRESSADVLRILDLIEHGDRVVLVGDVALAVGRGQQGVVGEAEFAGALTRAEKSRRTQESPVQILRFAQRIEEGLAGRGLRLVCGREVGRAQENLPGSDLQAGRSADYEVAFYPGAAHEIDELLG